MRRHLPTDRIRGWMPGRVFSLSALALFAAAAEGRAEPPNPPSLPPAQSASAGRSAPAFPCEPAQHLSTAEQLLAALHAEWPRPGVGISPITVELIADADLVVKSDRLAGPAYCTSRCTHEPRRVHCTGKGEPCRVPVRFRVNDAVPGVKVDGEAFAHEGMRLQVKAGTRFRLQQRVLEYHPEAPYYDPIITVENSCEIACQAGQRRCPATGRCIGEQGDGYCLSCTGLTRPECACRTIEGVLKPEATTCSFRAGDYFPTGTCKAGRCETRR